MIVDAYLVIRRPPKLSGQRMKIVRVTQRRPWLDRDEAMLRIRLDLPDDLFEDPALIVPVAKQEIAVAVELDGDIA